MIGYKKVIVWAEYDARDMGISRYIGCAILTLEIPDGAKRVMSNKRKQGLTDTDPRKCRASEAKVIAAEMLDGRPVPDGYTLRSGYASTFEYRVGKVAKCVGEFDDDPTEICTSGIHFFQTKKEAQEYFI